MDYDIIYSKRRTISITVRDGRVTVRCPDGTARARLDAFVEKHREWINKALARQERKRSLEENLTDEDVKRLKKEAKVYFTSKTEEYSKIMGLKYSRVMITSNRKRLGSCNTKGEIRYTYRLMLYSEPIRDYVVVHELAHLRHMDHSPRFWAVVAKYIPDYKERRRLLKNAE